MDTIIQKINEQVEKLKYLEIKRDMNLQILNNRIREIKEAKEGNDNKNKS